MFITHVSYEESHQFEHDILDVVWFPCAQENQGFPQRRSDIYHYHTSSLDDPKQFLDLSQLVRFSRNMTVCFFKTGWLYVYNEQAPYFTLRRLHPVRNITLYF